MGLFALLYAKGGYLNKGSLPEFNSGLYADNKDYGNVEGRYVYKAPPGGDI